MQLINDKKYDCCPLCHSGNIKALGKFEYPEQISYSTLEIKLSHQPELWKCGRCRSEFVQNILEQETSRDLYSSSDAAVRWSADEFANTKTKRVVEAMTQILDAAGSLLDVGCNTGELLDFARGLGCETSGVEYSGSSRSILARKGHQAYSSFDQVSGKYDVITAFDLVEHLYDITGFLNGCREKLADKGKLVILTGDAESISAKLAGAHWWYAQYPEHIVFPSRKYFRDYSGLSIESWLPTYASRGYQFPLVKSLTALVKGILKGGYKGLPSLGPDHVLVVLRK